MEDWKNDRAEAEMLKFEMDQINKHKSEREKLHSQLREKYQNLEDKIPSVWETWEEAGRSMENALAKTWMIKDPELVRVIALVMIRVPGLDLSQHVDPGFTYSGLYPETQKVHKILPDNLKISQALKMLFMKEDFKYVNGGYLKGPDLLRIADIIEDRFEGDFLLFDNAGGRVFDVMINLEEFPNRVGDFLEYLKKENPSWILAYRIDGVEKIEKKLTKLILL